MMQGTNNYVMITASSKGLGKAIAKEFASKGFNIILNGSKNRTICEETATEVEAFGVDTLVAMGNVGIAHADVKNIFHI